ncbi:hypothetical protein G6514_009651 [Epicoccum nigrum]|nr:hypothetical protein G6514_009651 [Epicoccum nigrum]
MSGPIASAVVLPEPDDAAPPPAASPSNALKLKRRQSTVADGAPEDSSVKRARTNGDDSNSNSNTNTNAEEGQPAAPKRRERGRERRLFGAVLGALSQVPTTAGQKRRSEIEKRQAAQRRQQDEESEQRKAERLARRKVQRQKETRRFERLAMKARHDNMLHLAHFLYTEAEPRLYYKPWEMSLEEEDRIDDQIADARNTIQRERDEFEAREEDERRRERRPTPDATTYRGTDVAMTGEADAALPQAGSEEATNGQEPHAQDLDRDLDMQDQDPRPVEPALSPQPADDPAAATQPREPDNEPSKDADEEEVVEAAEDTVIY